MLVARRPATEFMDLAAVAPVERYVLPVPVAADEDQVVQLLLLYPIQEGLSLGPKAVRVGVVVILGHSIRADDGRGRDEYAPVGVAFEEGTLEPLQPAAGSQAACQITEQTLLIPQTLLDYLFKQSLRSIIILATG